MLSLTWSLRNFKIFIVLFLLSYEYDYSFLLYFAKDVTIYGFYLPSEEPVGLWIIFFIFFL